MLNTIYNLLRLKCPRCHEGDLFEGAAYHPKYTINMPARCAKCKQPYFLEPGFYYGAMYLSYALNVGLGLVSFFIIWAILGFEKATFMKSALAAMFFLFLIFPINLRVSRAIWLYIFYKQDPTFYSDSDQPRV